MTKEELEKEAEEYARDTYEMCSYQGLPYASDRRARQQAFLAGAEPREKRIAELEAQIEKMKKYGKLLQDICDVMGDGPYMVWRGLEQRVLTLWDKSEEAEGLKMADDILDRLLEIKPQEWAEITKWEIKEK